MNIRLSHSSSTVTTLATCVCLLQGCQHRDVAGTDEKMVTLPSRLQGKVLDSRTMRGINGVRVSVSGIGIERTDHDGTYSLPGNFTLLNAAPITIRAEAEGYIPSTVAVFADGDSLRVPTVLLDALAAFVEIGPAGGTINVVGGARIEVPPGAVDRSAFISATAMQHSLRLPRSGGSVRQVFPGIHLEVEGAELSRPVTVTLPLPRWFRGEGVLQVLILDETTLRWESDGFAGVSSDRQTAMFQTQANNVGVILPNVRVRYELDVQKFEDPNPDESVLHDCLAGYYEFIKTYISSPIAPQIGTFTNSVYHTATIKHEITEIGTTSSGMAVINEGRKRKVTAQYYEDEYRGTGRAVTEQLNDDGTWTILDEGRVDVSFMRLRRVIFLQNCHQQGAGG